MEINIYKIENNLYVTSDEEFIEEGDYGIDLDDNSLFKCKSKYGEEFTSELLKNGNLRGLSDYDNCRKIILTTDPTLITDGVQSIDDDFLKWFVENSSCEFVKTKLVHDYEEHPELVSNPKEECTMNYCDDNGCQNRKRHLVEPHEQETLEEAAVKEYATIHEQHQYDAFIKGAKFQAKIMYSEKDVLELLCKREWCYEHTIPFISVDDWFEQNKKK